MLISKWLKPWHCHFTHYKGLGDELRPNMRCHDKLFHERHPSCISWNRLLIYCFCYSEQLCRLGLQYINKYRQVSNIRRTKSKHSCGCLCRIPWSQMLNREWRCSWSSADRRYSNYIWVIDNFIAYQGESYIRGFTVFTFSIMCKDYDGRDRGYLGSWKPINRLWLQTIWSGITNITVKSLI